MIPLLSKLRELCAFDEAIAKRNWTHGTYDGSIDKCSEMAVYNARTENARLLPLLTALIEIVEEQGYVLDFYASALETNNDIIGEPNIEMGAMPAKLGTRAREAQTKTQSKLSALVKGGAAPRAPEEGE